MKLNNVPDKEEVGSKREYLSPAIAAHFLSLDEGIIEETAELEALPTLEEIANGDDGVHIQALMVWFRVYSNLTLIGLREFADHLEAEVSGSDEVSLDMKSNCRPAVAGE